MPRGNPKTRVAMCVKGRTLLFPTGAKSGAMGVRMAARPRVRERVEPCSSMILTRFAARTEGLSRPSGPAVASVANAHLSVQSVRESLFTRCTGVVTGPLGIP